MTIGCSLCNPSVNNRQKSTYKNQKRSRLPRRSFDMVQGLKQLFNQVKTVEKRNGFGAEDAKLQNFIFILNDMGFEADIYLEAVQHFINVSFTHTAFLTMCEDMTLSQLQFTLRQSPPPPQYSHQLAPLRHGYQTPFKPWLPNPLHLCLPYPTSLLSPATK